MKKQRKRPVPVNKKGPTPAALVPYTQQPFKPTDKQREAVEIMAGYGLPQDQIA
jgi:hypothetical protein